MRFGKNGLFNTAKKAAKEYEINEIIEKIQISIQDLQMKKISNNEEVLSLKEDVLPKLYKEKIIIEDYGVQREESGKETVEVLTEKGYIIEITKKEDGSYEVKYKKEAEGTSNMETIDNEGPKIEETFEEENTKLIVKLQDEKSGLKNVKIEKITSITETGEQVYTQVGQIYQYTKEQQQQTIEENIRASYKQYLRGYKITAIDQCGNETIKEVTNLSILNNEAIIYTAKELKDFADSVNLGNTYKGITVQLGQDIDLSELKDSSGKQLSWVPIGNYDSEKDKQMKFEGEFNGNGHTISNMKITNIKDQYVGLFGYVNAGSKISNLILKDYNIDINVSGPINIGALVGYYRSGTISNISAIGNISISNSDAESIGGLIGYNYDGTIEKVYTGGNIKNNRGGYIGGIVGQRGYIKNSYSTANIEAGVVEAAGGIVGTTATIENCYSLGEISVLGDVGGITGKNAGITNSYWCNEIITEPTNKKGTGLTKTQMKNISSYSGWNISTVENVDTIWIIREGEYPKLRWME